MIRWKDRGLNIKDLDTDNTGFLLHDLYINKSKILTIAAKVLMNNNKIELIEDYSIDSFISGMFENFEPHFIISLNTKDIKVAKKNALTEVRKILQCLIDDINTG